MIPMHHDLKLLVYFVVLFLRPRSERSVEVSIGVASVGGTGTSTFALFLVQSLKQKTVQEGNV